MWVRAPFPVMMLRLCPLVDNTDYWLLPSIFDYAQGENQPPMKILTHFGLKLFFRSVKSAT